MRPEEQRLLQLLQANAREPLASLSRKLGVARSTVQSWMERFENQGIIAGYTVRLGDAARRRRVRAHVMIGSHTERTREVEQDVAKIPEVRRLHTISGQDDLIVELEADSTEQIGELIDRIREIEGVLRTHTSILLATHIDR